MTESGREARDRDTIAGSLGPRDHELIAAFIDQRLSAEERAAFIQRLERDEALYDVFAETVRFHDRRSGRPATVVSHPRSRARWLLPAAAAAAVVLAAATTLLVRGAVEPGYAEILVASGGLETAPGGGWYDPSWARTRGISAALPESDAAFRAGVLALDLEVALRLELAEDSFILTRRLERTLEEIDFSEPLRAYYAQLGARLEAGAPNAPNAPSDPNATLRELAEGAERLFVEQFPDLERAYRLGRLAEAGKLAARSGNRELLGSRSFGRDLRGLARGGWDPPVTAGLDTAAGLLEAPRSQLDLGALEAAFVAILSEG